MRIALPATLLLTVSCQSPTLQEPLEWEDDLPGDGQAPSLEDARLVEVSGSDLTIAIWEGALSAWAAKRGGEPFSKVRHTTYRLATRNGLGDPRLVDGTGDEDEAGDGEGLYMVQFYTPPFEEYRRRLRSLGGKVFHYLPNNAHLVRMTPEVRRQVEGEPFVRWVGPFGPRIDGVHDLLPGRPSRYYLQPVDQDPAAKQRLAAWIRERGGVVHVVSDRGSFTRSTKIMPSR